MAGAATEKVLVRVSPTVLFYICLPLSCDSLQQMDGASEKVLWRIPPTVLLYNLSPSLLRLSVAKGCCFRKGFLEGSPNSFGLLGQMAAASEKVLRFAPRCTVLAESSILTMNVDSFCSPPHIPTSFASKTSPILQFGLPKIYGSSMFLLHDGSVKYKAHLWQDFQIWFGE